MLLDMNIKLRRGHFDLTTQISVAQNSVGLFGKSGAGKTTLLNLIAGVIQPQTGHIVLDGKILFDSSKGIMMPREQRPIGAVLQQDCIASVETVRETLTSAYNRTFKQRRVFTLDYLIGLLELGSILDLSLERLAEDERQRVAVARALLKSPRILLLDETFAAIGNTYRDQLLPILSRMQYEFGLPVMYASQSLGEILNLTDKLILLEKGKVLQSGSLREVSKQAGMLSYLGIRQIDNILPVTIRQHDKLGGCSMADSFGLPLALPLRSQFSIGSQTQVSIRASDIALSRQYIDGISIQNQIKGRICALIPSGESLIVQVDCGCAILVEITPSAFQNMALQEGDIVYCLIKTHSIIYLAELDSLPYQRVVNYGDGYYYLNSSSKSGTETPNNFLLN
jgi:molybdate transport system ATP-binding protein